MTAHRLTVQRTATVMTSGTERGAKEIWYLLHGYGQRAESMLATCGVLEQDSRLLVAPEALSRFYIAERPTVKSHAEARVGASWMTREHRADEIADYVAYLDAVHTAMLATAAPSARVTILGFSQGVAVAVRWATFGSVRANRVIAWGATLPDDALASSSPCNGASIVAVVGTQDAIIGDAISDIDEQIGALRSRGNSARIQRYEGGHVIDVATLRVVAREL